MAKAKKQISKTNKRNSDFIIANIKTMSLPPKNHIVSVFNYSDKNCVFTKLMTEKEAEVAKQILLDFFE